MSVAEYIKIEDLYKILYQAEQFDGYINERTLKLSITKLNKYRKPKHKTNKSDRPIIKGVNSIDMKNNIRRYWRDVTKGIQITYWERNTIGILPFGKTQTKAIIGDLEVFGFASCSGKDHIMIQSNIKSILPTLQEVADILKISIKKAQRLRDHGIIKKYTATKLSISPFTDELDIKNGYFYDLNVVFIELNALK